MWRECKVDDCHNPARTKSTEGGALCAAHDARWRKRGSLEKLTNEGVPLAERLAMRIERGGPDDCWPWTGSVVGMGYGNIRLSGNGKMVRTHRLAYELAIGPIPDGAHVLHSCDNPPCCNPAHLFLGTHADNMRDRQGKGRNPQSKKTHCPQGHRLAGSNLYLDPRGKRQCRICRVEATRRSQAKRR